MNRWTPPDPEQRALRELYLTRLDEHPRAWSRECPAAHLTATAVICDPTRERVLLIKHRKVGLWLPTGGHIEPDDASVPAAALRESVEESGVAALSVLDGVTWLSRHPAPCDTADWHLDVQFTVVVDEQGTAVEDLGSHESTAAGWFGWHELPEPTDDAVRQLVAASISRLR
ncbi:NUDIX hydrolase [Propionibacteriaceae bacterium Y2011]